MSVTPANRVIDLQTAELRDLEKNIFVEPCSDDFTEQ